jgi:hypothetical protein
MIIKNKAQKSQPLYNANNIVRFLLLSVKKKAILCSRLLVYKIKAQEKDRKCFSRLYGLCRAWTLGRPESVRFLLQLLDPAYTRMEDALSWHTFVYCLPECDASGLAPDKWQGIDQADVDAEIC